MKQSFLSQWKSSVQPRKQRKYRAEAPLHVQGTFLSAHLSKELRKKYLRRSLRVKKGDKVKIMRGQFKGKTNKVDRVNLKNGKVYITGIETIKKDGSKTMYPFEPSNLLLTELNATDKKRLKVSQKKGEKDNGKTSP